MRSRNQPVQRRSLRSLPLPASYSSINDGYLFNKVKNMLDKINKANMASETVAVMKHLFNIYGKNIVIEIGCVGSFKNETRSLIQLALILSIREYLINHFESNITKTSCTELPHIYDQEEINVLKEYGIDTYTTNSNSPQIILEANKFTICYLPGAPFMVINRLLMENWSNKSLIINNMILMTGPLYSFINNDCVGSYLNHVRNSGLLIEFPLNYIYNHEALNKLHLQTFDGIKLGQNTEMVQMLNTWNRSFKERVEPPLRPASRDKYIYRVLLFSGLIFLCILMCFALWRMDI